MKQSEFEKLLNKIAKDLSDKYGWKSRKGFVFKKREKVFFTIILSGRPKTNDLSWMLWFKYYEFDDLFWKIVKLEENSKQPLSFRACGAWVAPSKEILSGSKKLDEWNEKSVFEEVDKILNHLDSVSLKISKSIVSPESNLVAVEEHYQAYRKRYPNALKDIWVEKLLTYLILEKNSQARTLAQARIDEGNHGGFSVEGKSFFKLALDYIETITNN